MVKYVIFGNGFLGNRFGNYLGEDAILLREKIGQVATYREIKFLIKEYSPDVVINCIGKTGRPNIDWCEMHKTETFFSNVTIPTLMAEVCENADVKMVHIGSGCIYQTNESCSIKFSEYSRPNFKGSFYSRTKIFSENILEEYNNILQVRIRMPIDTIPSPRNLIDKLKGYKRVIGDIPNSVTCIPDLLTITKTLIDRNETGIFNVTNKGAITHREILEMYCQIVDPSFKMPEFISLEELKNLTIAERSNCVLHNKRLDEKGIEIRHVLGALIDCLHEYRKNLKGE